MSGSRGHLGGGGFTLIEIISVIMVVGILSAVALPFFDTSSISAASGGAVVQTDLNFLQELAMARNATVNVTFTNGSNSYTITDPGGAFSVTRTLPSGVTITSATTAVGFNQYGEPTFAGASAVITVATGGKISTITVNQYTGNVTLS